VREKENFPSFGKEGQGWLTGVVDNFEMKIDVRLTKESIPLTRNVERF